MGTTVLQGGESSRCHSCAVHVRRAPHRVYDDEGRHAYRCLEPLRLRGKLDGRHHRYDAFRVGNSGAVSEIDNTEGFPRDILTPRRGTSKLVDHRSRKPEP